ncbi:MAG: hypothetical protein WDN04_26145 [Rhodospirillales bacterium]
MAEGNEPANNFAGPEFLLTELLGSEQHFYVLQLTYFRRASIFTPGHNLRGHLSPSLSVNCHQPVQSFRHFDKMLTFAPQAAEIAEQLLRFVMAVALLQQQSKFEAHLRAYHSTATLKGLKQLELATEVERRIEAP